MTPRLPLCAAALAALISPAAMADDQVGEPPIAQTAVGQASPVRLIAWDGDFELMKTSRRLRVWRAGISYTMTVDPAGNATGCELNETFRRAYVMQQICEVLMEHHTFEPAHDAAGTPIAGTYSATMSYEEIRERLGD